VDQAPRPSIFRDFRPVGLVTLPEIEDIKETLSTVDTANKRLRDVRLGLEMAALVGTYENDMKAEK
jgi:hypothetical protein